MKKPTKKQLKENRRRQIQATRKRTGWRPKAGTVMYLFRGLNDNQT